MIIKFIWILHGIFSKINYNRMNDTQRKNNNSIDHHSTDKRCDTKCLKFSNTMRRWMMFIKFKGCV